MTSLGDRDFPAPLKPKFWVYCHCSLLTETLLCGARLYLRVELVGYITIWRTTRLFSKVGLIYSHFFCQNLSVFYFNHPSGYESLTEVLICISLMVNNDEQHFICLLTTCVSSLQKYLFEAWCFNLWNGDSNSGLIISLRMMQWKDLMPSMGPDT